MGRGPSSTFKLGYHPALDGVRGIAVLIVMLYHLRVVVWEDAGWWLPTGGYISLDVFFALSGFLITCLLIADHERHGRVSLGRFMTRRIRRLFPALVAVLVALLVAASIGAGTHDLGDATARSLWTLAFLHNWAFESRLLIELGQIWSLAIEGQFYVLWSLIVTAVLLTGRRARVALVTLATVIVIVVAITRTIRFDNGDNFYVVYLATTSRIDGPLLGAIAGVAYASGWLDRVTQRWATAMTAVGMAGIAYVTVRGALFDSYQRDWGGYTINAGLGALVILGSVLHTRGAMTRFLAWTPFVRCGQWSYSLFLWHMPVFILLYRNAPDLAMVPKAVLGMAASFALAIGSYKLVELPFLRSGRGTSRPAGPAEPPAPAAVTTVTGAPVTLEGPAAPAAGNGAPVPAGSNGNGNGNGAAAEIAVEGPSSGPVPGPDGGMAPSAGTRRTHHV